MSSRSIFFNSPDTVTVKGKSYAYHLAYLREIDIDVERFNKIEGRVDCGIDGSWGFSIQIDGMGYDVLYNFCHRFLGTLSFNKVEGKLVYVLIDPKEKAVAGFMHTPFMINEPHYFLIKENNFELWEREKEEDYRNSDD
jgi:hypothetical protein